MYQVVKISTASFLKMELCWFTLAENLAILGVWRHRALVISCFLNSIDSEFDSAVRDGGGRRGGGRGPQLVWSIGYAGPGCLQVKRSWIETAFCMLLLNNLNFFLYKSKMNTFSMPGTVKAIIQISHLVQLSVNCNYNALFLTSLWDMVVTINASVLVT